MVGAGLSEAVVPSGKRLSLQGRYIQHSRVFIFLVTRKSASLGHWETALECVAFSGLWGIHSPFLFFSLAQLVVCVF